MSANPTGPIHVGHGRGAAAGASLAALLRLGRRCIKNIINNVGRNAGVGFAGNEYLAQVGRPVDLPAGCYQASILT